ncbi:MAG: hypothetical protein Kow0089_13770 [Desulfobulbaceae bacterium]
MQRVRFLRLPAVAISLTLLLFYTEASVAVSAMEEGEARDPAGIVFEEHLVPAGSRVDGTRQPETEGCAPLSTGADSLPKVAIIIDDMGHHRRLGSALIDLDLNLTFSFLPHAPLTAEHAEIAWNKGRDVLVHMPMEPGNRDLDPGPGALFLSDPDEVIASNVRANIAAVPHAIGINNHMGSRFTADRRAMRAVLSVLREKHLFFVDSVTTPGTVGEEEARNMGIPARSRIVFLDNVQDSDDICRRLKQLVAHATRYGSGVGIGHPNRATLEGLTRCREMLRTQVRLVGVRELVR